MDLNCLFWNVNGMDVHAEIVGIVEEKAINIIALAEYNGDGRQILSELVSQGYEFFLIPRIGCDRIVILVRFSGEYINHAREGDRYTIKEIRIPGMLPILLCVVHLPSKLHAADDGQAYYARGLIDVIEASERDFKHSNTVVFGDFNMNPFDAGMMAVDAFNSLSCRKDAGRMQREYYGRSHKFFYNPSWGLLGDMNGSPGTYYHSSPALLSRYWNMLDQVILRPEISNRFDVNLFAVLSKVRGRRLVDRNGRPSVSDHLPIIFSIKINSEV
jgi:exonuclease III